MVSVTFLQHTLDMCNDATKGTQRGYSSLLHVKVEQPNICCSIDLVCDTHQLEWKHEAEYVERLRIIKYVRSFLDLYKFESFSHSLRHKFTANISEST